MHVMVSMVRIITCTVESVCKAGMSTTPNKGGRSKGPDDIERPRLRQQKVHRMIDNQIRKRLICSSCFYHLFQVKKVKFGKVLTAGKKPSPLLFVYLLFYFFFYDYSTFFT